MQSPISVTENKLFVPKPKDFKTTDKLPDLWKRMAIQSLISETGYTEIPFDMYCPTVQKGDIYPRKFAKTVKRIFPVVLLSNDTEKAMSDLVLLTLLMVMFQKTKKN